MNLAVNTLQDQLRTVRMVETAGELPTLLRQAEQSSWTYLEFLQELLRH